MKLDQPKPVSHISRRDAVCLVAAALWSNLVAADTAEARRIKPETREKIREKINKLREEGITKEKTDPNLAGRGQDLQKSSFDDDSTSFGQ